MKRKENKSKFDKKLSVELKKNDLVLMLNDTRSGKFDDRYAERLTFIETLYQ